MNCYNCFLDIPHQQYLASSWMKKQCPFKRWSLLAFNKYLLLSWPHKIHIHGVEMDPICDLAQTPQEGLALQGATPGRAWGVEQGHEGM